MNIITILFVQWNALLSFSDQSIKDNLRHSDPKNWPSDYDFNFRN